MQRLNLYWLLSINTEINTSALNTSAKWQQGLFHALRKGKRSPTVCRDFVHLSEEFELHQFLFSCFYVKIDSHGIFSQSFSLSVPFQG